MIGIDHPKKVIEKDPFNLYESLCGIYAAFLLAAYRCMISLVKGLCTRTPKDVIRLDLGFPVRFDPEVATVRSTVCDTDLPG